MTDNGTAPTAHDQTPISQVQAIDVHAHYGDCVVADNEPLTSEFLTASAEEVARRARQAQIEWTVVSPLLGLFPRGNADAAAGTLPAFSFLSPPGEACDHRQLAIPFRFGRSRAILLKPASALQPATMSPRVSASTKMSTKPCGPAPAGRTRCFSSLMTTVAAFMTTSSRRTRAWQQTTHRAMCRPIVQRSPLILGGSGSGSARWCSRRGSRPTRRSGSPTVRRRARSTISPRASPPRRSFSTFQLS